MHTETLVLLCQTIRSRPGDTFWIATVLFILTFQLNLCSNLFLFPKYSTVLLCLRFTLSPVFPIFLSLFVPPYIYFPSPLLLTSLSLSPALSLNKIHLTHSALSLPSSLSTYTPFHPLLSTPSIPLSLIIPITLPKQSHMNQTNAWC